MTVRDYLNHQIFPIRLFGSIGFYMFIFSCIAVPIGFLQFVVIAGVIGLCVFLVCVSLVVFLPRCPECRHRVGRLSVLKLFDPMLKFGPKAQFCPHCRLDFNSDICAGVIVHRDCASSEGWRVERETDQPG